MIDMTTRKRFDGVLDADELARARAAGTPLAYCPQQQGWVPLAAEDDEDTATPLSWKVAAQPLHKLVPGQPVYTRPESLSLRVWVEDDLPVYRALMADPGLWTHMLETMPARLDDETLKALIALSSEGAHHTVRAAVLGAQPIGQVRLEHGADRTMGEISYWLGAAVRGKGLGRQMVSRFLDRLARTQPQLSRITARVHPANHASQRLLVACGFRPCDRDSLALAPRGRDAGDWLGYVYTRA